MSEVPLYMGRKRSTRQTPVPKKNNFTETCSGSKEGSYIRLIELVSLNSRLESNEKEEDQSDPGMVPTKSSNLSNDRPSNWIFVLRGGLGRLT